MTQLDLLHSIEEKRDMVINARNLLIMKIQEEGNSHENQKQLSRFQGKIEAYNSILDVIRADLIAESLKEWANA